MNPLDTPNKYGQTLGQAIAFWRASEADLCDACDGLRLYERYGDKVLAEVWGDLSQDDREAIARAHAGLE